MADVFLACSRSEWTRAEEIFASNPSKVIRYKDRQRWTVLHEACGRPDVPFSFVQSLLSNGMDPNFQNLVFRTALHYAIQPLTPLRTIALLLQHGANPNLADKEGKTAMHWISVENMSIAVLHLLVAARGDLAQRDDEGKTPLHLAIELDVDYNLLRELVMFCPQAINLPDYVGCNALTTCLMKSSPPLWIKLLLEYGGKIDTQHMRVAKYHADAILCAQVERAQLFTLLASPATIKRLGLQSKLHLFPLELLRVLQHFLFPMPATQAMEVE